MKNARGSDKVIFPSECINFVLLHGCKPGLDLKPDNDVISTISRTMFQRLERVTFAIQMPGCFKGMRTKHTNFEMAMSATLRPCRLVYSYNVVTHSIAVIFNNTHVNVHLGNLLKPGLGDHTTL